MIDFAKYDSIVADLKPYEARLVAVSKKKSVNDIKMLVDYGQKDFGENYVQELSEKHESLPRVDWHFIGHLQSNKIKFISPFCTLIHGIDNINLLKEVDKQAMKSNRIQDCLLQIHIAKEDTKFGFSFDDAEEILTSDLLNELKNVSVKGMMGMASMVDDDKIIKDEFRNLSIFFNRFKNKTFNILSMGMSADYKIALEEGSTMVRIGSAIFGGR